MTLVIVFGCRPEAIKLGPVVAELRNLGVEPALICTGQHTTLLKGTPVETDLANASSLGLTSDGRVERWLRFAWDPLERVLSPLPPDAVVVVQGDTMSALAAARVTRRGALTLCHVEAGVRSHDAHEPWPEEMARVEIDSLANWHYAPTATAFSNLIAEGHALTNIRLTGNPVVSALARYTAAQPVAPPLAHILITLHRREWLEGATFGQTLVALAEAARHEPRLTFRWPAHPATVSRMTRLWLGHLPANFVVEPPLPYAEAAQVLASATAVLTDSGGLQEEAATLGVPCAVLRRVADRPESIEEGSARRFNPDGTGVADAMHWALSGATRRQPSDCYGDVTAASQIARHLASLVD